MLAAVPGADYRNGDDPVPYAPIGYMHAREMTQLGAWTLELDVIGDHMIDRYVAALGGGG